MNEISTAPDYSNNACAFKVHIGSSSPREHWLSREANRFHLAEGIRRNALHNLHVSFFFFCQVMEDAYV